MQTANICISLQSKHSTNYQSRNCRKMIAFSFNNFPLKNVYRKERAMCGHILFQMTIIYAYEWFNEMVTIFDNCGRKYVMTLTPPLIHQSMFILVILLQIKINWLHVKWIEKPLLLAIHHMICFIHMKIQNRVLQIHIYRKRAWIIWK